MAAITQSDGGLQTKGQHRQHHQRADHVAVEQRGLVGIGARDDAGGHRVEPVAGGGGEREQRRRLHAAGTGPRDQQHPAEAEHDRAPAPPADPFPQHRAGDDRHDEGKREYDRQHIGELHVAQRQEVERGGGDQQQRARDLQPQLGGAQQAGRGQRIGDEKRQQEGAGVARPHDLQAVHVGIEVFRRGVEAGEQRHRAAHQRDADQTLAALLGGVGNYVSLLRALSCQRRSTRWESADRTKKITMPAAANSRSAANMRGMLSR